jgi:hypothetical protein
MTTKGQLASAELTSALIRAAARGIRPRCADAETSHYWTSESEGERRLAQLWCAGCEVEIECFAAARANRESWGVWSGVDFSTRAGQRKAAAA